MNEVLWAGPALKLEYAQYHYTEMGQSIQPPEHTWTSAALESSGAIIDTGWQRKIYAHLDAFLSATWSVPAIIQCCFGADPFTQRQNHQMKDWFDQLSQDEKDRRQLFNDRFKLLYDNFRKLSLAPIRHTIEHRTGVAPASVAITSMYGVTHIGGPGKPVPATEMRQIDDPNLAHLAKPHVIRPMWNDFYIDGQSLFPTCQNFLAQVGTIVNDARVIAQQVHGTKTLSSPPT
jgi:hypothetical protein